MKETMNYHTTIRETPAIRVAALAHRGDYNQIATTFEQLAAIAASMNLFGPYALVRNLLRQSIGDAAGCASIRCLSYRGGGLVAERSA